MSKLLFIDVDEIIMNFDGYIPDSAVEAISKVRKHGNKICLFTAKPQYQIKKTISNIEFDSMISGSGSYVEYEGVCINHIYFTFLNCISLCQYLVEHQSVIEFQTHDNCYILEKDIQKFKEIENKIKNIPGETSVIVEQQPKVIDSVINIHEIERILFYSNELSTEKLMKRYSEYLNVVALNTPNPLKWGGEITPIMVNKESGIEKIIQASEKEQQDVIIIDEYNDLNRAFEKLELI